MRRPFQRAMSWRRTYEMDISSPAVYLPELYQALTMDSRGVGASWAAEVAVGRGFGDNRIRTQAVCLTEE